MAERDDRIEEHLRRVNELLAAERNEHRLNRTLQQRHFELTQTIVERNTQAFAGMMAALDRFGSRIGAAFDDFGSRIDDFGSRIDDFGSRIDDFGERIDAFGERVDAFGATLDLQREILLRFLDRLDETEPPQG